MRKGEKRKKMQEKLREQVKIIKAMYGDEYKYIDFAEYLEMNINSFYNFTVFYFIYYKFFINLIITIIRSVNLWIEALFLYIK